MRSVLVRREFTSRFSLTLLALRAQDILQPIVRHGKNVFSSFFSTIMIDLHTGLLCLDSLNHFAVSH